MTRMAITAKTVTLIIATSRCLLDPRRNIKFMITCKAKMTTTTIKSPFASATMSLG